jgi:uncharacterized membrane protein YczE
MIEPPLLRGRAPLRFGALVLGLALFAFGIVLLLESRLGLPPWAVLNQGIAERTALSFGAANIAVAVLVLVLAWSIGSRVGVGTVANAVLIGVFVELLLSRPTVERLSEQGLGARVAMMIGGIVVIGVGSALYIGAGMGAGPRDSLMLVLARRTGFRIGGVRVTLEVAVTLVGLVLGGTVGVGTLAFAFGIGPAVELSFRALAHSPLVGPGAAGPARSEYDPAR